MGRMDERELFRRQFESVEPDTLWAVLKRTLSTMDLKSTDDAAREARFATSVTNFSWGQHMLATITSVEPSGAMLTVRGRPKASFMTSGWGEKRHGREIEKQLIADIERDLSHT